MEDLKTCPSSKRRFETEDDAKYAARESMLFRDSPELATYFCLICLGFHLTSSIKDKKTKRRTK
jgi:hypothetical protein